MVQYPSLCVSWGLLFVSVRACSSWLSSLFRDSCKFSADTSAVLMAPTASERREDKPTSIPSPLNKHYTYSVCVCVCVSRPQPKLTGFQAEEWKRAVVITFLQAVCPGFIYSCLPVSFITVKAGKSGKTAQAPLALCLSFTSSSSSLGQKKKSQDAPSAR